MSKALDIDTYWQLVENTVVTYKRDIQIDKDYLTAVDYKVSFFHAFSDTGTHIVSLRHPNTYPPPGERVRYLMGHATREHILEDTCKTLNAFLVLRVSTCWRQGLRVFYGSLPPTKMTEVTYPEAMAIIDRYKKAILAYWRHLGSSNEFWIS